LRRPAIDPSPRWAAALMTFAFLQAGENPADLWGGRR
jgi:hypothetical protein